MCYAGDAMQNRITIELPATLRARLINGTFFFVRNGVHVGYVAPLEGRNQLGAGPDMYDIKVGCGFGAGDLVKCESLDAAVSQFLTKLS